MNRPPVVWPWFAFILWWGGLEFLTGRSIWDEVFVPGFERFFVIMGNVSLFFL